MRSQTRRYARVFPLCSLVLAVLFGSTQQPIVAQGQYQPLSSANIAQIKQVGQLYDGRINSAAWSPDGQLLALGGSTGLWIAQTSAIGTRPTFFGVGGIDQLFFSHDSKTIFASQSGADKVASFDPSSGAQQKQFNIVGDASHFQAPQGPLALTQDGKLLVAACFTESSSQQSATTIVLWDTQSGTQLRQFVGHTDEVTALAFSADGTVLASASANDKTIRLWNVQTGDQQQVITQENEIDHLVFAPDGKTLYSSGNYMGFMTGAAPPATINSWDVATGKHLVAFGMNSDPADEVSISSVTALALNPAGTQLYFIGGGLESKPNSGTVNGIAVWDLKTNKLVSTTPLHTFTDYEGIHADISPDLTRVVAYDTSDIEEMPVIDIDLKTGKKQPLDIHPGDGLDGFAISPDSKTIALTAPYNGGKGVELVNSDTLTPLPISSTTRKLKDINGGWFHFSADGKTLYAGPFTGTTYSIDATKGTISGRHSWGKGLDGEDKGGLKVFSPDGTLLGISFTEYKSDPTQIFVFDPVASAIFHIYSLPSYREIAKLKGPPGPASSSYATTHLMFSSDGTRLVSFPFEADGTPMCFWDLKSGKQLACAAINGHEVESLVINTDDKWVLTTLDNGEADVWDMATGKQLQSPSFNLSGGYFDVLGINVNGTFLAGCSGEQTDFWDTTTGKQLATIKNGGCIDMKFTPDGTRLVTAGNDGALHVFAIPTQ